MPTGGDGDEIARARALAATLSQTADLVEKYRLLEALHAGEPGRTTARRDAIREVADRFPAAMREWDEAPPEEISRRRAEVEAVLAALVADLEKGNGIALLHAPDRSWIRWAADLHERLRAALRVKRWLAGRDVTDALAADAERLFGLDRSSLDAIASPEGGRFTEGVYREVAAAHGVTVDAIKSALFPKE